MNVLDNRTEGNGSELAIEIGKKMNKARIAFGYSLRELAGLMNISATHLNRIEKGERILDSIDLLISFCKNCHEPIEDYLIMLGWQSPENTTPIRKAFPAIETTEQEDTITALSRIIVTRRLNKEDMDQIVINVTAYANYCDIKNLA